MATITLFAVFACAPSASLAAVERVSPHPGLQPVSPQSESRTGLQLGSQPGLQPGPQVGSPSEEEPFDIERLMRAARLDEAVREFAAAASDAIVQGFEEVADGSTPDDGEPGVDVVARAATASFAPPRMWEIFVANLDAALEAEDIARLIAYHESDLGQRLLDADDTRTALEHPEDYAAFLRDFGAAPGDAERLALLTELVVGSGAARMLAQLVIDVQLVSLHGAVALSGESLHDERFAAASAPILASRDALADAWGRQLPPMLAYTYAAFSEAELRQVLSRALSPESRRMMQGMMAGLREVAVAGIDGFVARIEAERSLAEAGEMI